MTKDVYYQKRDEVISKFSSEFMIKYQAKSALLNNVLNELYRDANPYEIIEKLIDQHMKDIDILTEYCKTNYNNPKSITL